MALTVDSPAAGTHPRLRWSSRTATVVRAYVALTKPRIIELLLVITVPSMMLAARGLPGITLVIATLIGGTLAAGSANALNCFLDRDIDAVMHRTQARPLNHDVVTPTRALVFGIALGMVAVAELLVTTNLLSALLALAAIAFYVGVYTALLKRRTSSNIVWGGAAGCMPVLIGWSSVTDSLNWTPFALFAIVFFWTPPHFWALAIKYRADYARAGVPMLPVVADDRLVADRIVAYSWLMVAVSLAVWPLWHTTLVYPCLAIVLGAAFLYEAYRLRARARHARELAPMRLFHASITYLSLLFLVIAIEALLEAAS